jgi:hypothetical protein
MTRAARRLIRVMTATPATNAMAPATMQTMLTVNAEASLSSGIGMCSWL